MNWDAFFDAGGVAGLGALVWQAAAAFLGHRHRPKLEMLPFNPERDLRIWLDNNNVELRRMVLTIEVRNNGRETARRCVATLQVLEGPVMPTEPRFSLHWAGVDYTFETTGATPVDIGAEGRRLDVVFTDSRFPMPGCWAATGMALMQPGLHQAYLRAGDYRAKVTISCSNGARATREIKFTAPTQWDGLKAVVA